MQLRKKQQRRPGKSSGRTGLAAATMTLLGAAAPPVQAELVLPENVLEKPWTFDTGVLLYSEMGGRVQAVEPVINATRDLGDDRSISARIVVDTLTGASPNGAAPASQPQTFSGASGAGHTFTAPAYETPLDDTFRDTRVALSLDYVTPVSDDGKLGGGVSVSNEYDFFSWGGNLRYSLDFNQSNTTVSAGLSYEADSIEPVGGAPTPLGVLTLGDGEDEDENENEDEDDGPGGAGRPDALTRDVIDVLFGVTQVIDPYSLVQVNYSLSTSSGYHTDPYKILSVVRSDGEPIRYVYESRPDSRTKHAIYTHYKRQMFARDVFDLSYRFMTDDWGITSNTADTSYRWNFNSDMHLEPHLRWYTQTAADFYRVALFDGEESAFAAASADPRLGAFDAWTIGLKFGQTLASGSQWNARLEYYQQLGQLAGVPDEAANGLSKFKLEPDLSAVMLTIGYRFKW